MIRLTSLCSFVGALVVAACAADGTKTGNGVQMEFVATGQALTESDASMSRSLIATDLQGTTFVIDQAILIVSEIDLRAKGEDLCAFDVPEAATCTNGRIRLRGEMELDLLAPGSNAGLLAIEFPAVVYDRVEVRTQALEKDSALGAVSFFVAGQVTLNDETKPFVLSLKRNETLRFEDLDGVDVSNGQLLSAQIDLQAWFKGLPLTNCVEAGDVTLEQDTWLFTEDSKCKEIEQSFVAELLKATRLSKAQR